ncbi:3-hydroxyisobutyryl-CoA hydrolase 1 [Bienertia sinuspersici]
MVKEGNGRAFCAGGDVAAVVRDITEGDWRLGANFFRKEFTLNYLMATYRKSQVSILNGIVMGGGAGASLHGRFRIVTESTVFAMPETALGLFPDVGASYFLSRLPGFFGEYVGLTGKRLDGPEMLACGLATHYVHSSKLPLLEEELCEGNIDDPLNICKILDKYAEQPVLKENSAYRKTRREKDEDSGERKGRKRCVKVTLQIGEEILRLHIIDKCFSYRTVEEILSALEKEHAETNDDWVSAAIGSLKKASPTSLKISLKSVGSSSRTQLGLGLGWLAEQNTTELSADFKEVTVFLIYYITFYYLQFREGRLQGVGQCLIREYRMVCHVLRGEVSRDFFEGCRAILVDKDKNPKWNPSRLDLVSDNMVNHYFSKVNDEEWMDLKLPTRSNLPASSMAKL